MYGSAHQKLSDTLAPPPSVISKWSGLRGFVGPDEQQRAIARGPARDVEELVRVLIHEGVCALLCTHPVASDLIRSVRRILLDVEEGRIICPCDRPTTGTLI